MGTTRLKLYNDALLYCSEPELQSLAEEREPRRLLDRVWDNGWVNDVLERGAWQFAMRTSRLEIDDDFSTIDFGYRNAFTKPEDWVRTEMVCSDEYFRQPLRAYQDQVGHFFSDVEQLFLQYVSNDIEYGGDLSLWTPSFARYAASYGAKRIVGKLSGKSEETILLNGPPGRPELALDEKLLNEAQSLSARTQPTRVMNQGSWSKARASGRLRNDRDGGPTGSLL